jgi:hypothetical protein
MTDDNRAMLVADYLANNSRPKSLDQIIRGLNLEAVHRTTIWRWLSQAQEKGLIEKTGDRRHTLWSASHEMRKAAVRKQIEAPLAKRARIHYQEEFLQEYEPNRTHYLSKQELERLHRQCAPGSAAFAELTPRDQSLFLCGLSYASSSFEGNRYDMISTEKLLLEGFEMEGASTKETIMVINHHEAARYLIDNIHFPTRKNDVDVTARDIKSIHGLISTNLLDDPALCGDIRHSPVRINQSAYVPLSVHDAISRAFKMICEKAIAITDPYEQAFFLLVHIPYLQPFEDCNKRTSRVACNIPLLRRGVIPMSWLDVDADAYTNGLIGIYERNNTALLSEVFVDGFLHSAGRFEMMRRSATPNEIQIRYRSATKTLIRAIVLDGDTDSTPDVAPKDLVAFQTYVTQELELLRKGNIGALVRYQLSEGDVQEWMQHEADTPKETKRERMRG